MIRVRMQKNRQRGFTLIEALIAVVVLIFGLVAVTQLLAVAAGSNSVANRSSAAAAQATEQVERLMNVPFYTLGDQAGAGSLEVTESCGDASHMSERQIPGVGTIRTCWTVTTATSLNGMEVLHIQVRSQALGPFTNLTRADFTTFRTLNGLPSPTPTPTGSPGP